MRKTAAIIILICVILGLTGCALRVEEPEALLPEYGEQAREQIQGIVSGTFLPAPTAEPGPTPEPTEEPTPVPELTGPYHSEAYPLTPKSRRTQEGGMYPEEKHLNGDPDKFYCLIDLTNQCVFVYERDGDGDYTVLVREMIASCGTSATPTPVGVFKMQDDYKRFGYFVRFDCYAQYWSQIVGKIYFHSIPYIKRDSRYLDVEGFYMLGSPASHGCIRLLPDDAQWVYLYLCPGTTVRITNSLPRDEQLRARLMLISLPEPDAYEIDNG